MARIGLEQVFDIGKIIDYELYLKNINGSSIPVLYNASVYKDKTGQIMGALAIARDISAIKKRAAKLDIANKELAFQKEEKEKHAAKLEIANKELAFQNEEKEKRAVELEIANKELLYQQNEIEDINNQLEYVNKELKSLSYSISHDLKAPLRHIKGFISLLVKKYMNLLPEEGHRYLDNISLSAMNMEKLIDGLLQFSRTGRLKMNRELCNMNEIVDTLIQPNREQDQEHRIEFYINPLPPAFCDFKMIKSVWSNLIGNAIKFSNKKDLAIITIGAEENATEIIYYIKDNGAGFDMNYAAKLFTVFQRLHSKEDYDGTGIGLTIVNKIIERHGGRVWAEGKVGEGATFYFALMKRKEG
jgi:light-regulated signal transduction histidine kinase (bacteriophytochrome)